MDLNACCFLISLHFFVSGTGWLLNLEEGGELWWGTPLLDSHGTWLFRLELFVLVATYTPLTSHENTQGEESYFPTETRALPCVLQQCLFSVKHEQERVWGKSAVDELLLGTEDPLLVVGERRRILENHGPHSPPFAKTCLWRADESVADLKLSLQCLVWEREWTDILNTSVSHLQ